jgi:hypothetical protein
MHSYCRRRHRLRDAHKELKVVAIRVSYWCERRNLDRDYRVMVLGANVGWGLVVGC